MSEVTGVVMVLALFLAGVCLAALIEQVRPRRTPKPSPRWEVTVVPATRESYDYNRHGEPVDHAVAVRLRRGKQALTVETIKTADGDFESKLSEAVLAAEARAASLNAAAEDHGP